MEDNEIVWGDAAKASVEKFFRDFAKAGIRMEDVEDSDLSNDTVGFFCGEGGLGKSN